MSAFTPGDEPYLGIMREKTVCFQELRNARMLVIARFGSCGPVTRGRVLPNGWTELAALLAAFLISALTAPCRLLIQLSLGGGICQQRYMRHGRGHPSLSIRPT